MNPGPPIPHRGTNDLTLVGPGDQEAVCLALNPADFMGLTNSPAGVVDPTIELPESDDVACVSNDPHEQDVEQAAPYDPSADPPRLSRQDLRKVHLQIKHGTVTAVLD